MPELQELQKEQQALQEMIDRSETFLAILEIGVGILFLAAIFTWCLSYFKTGFSRMGKITGALLLLFSIRFIHVNFFPPQQETYDTEVSEQAPEEDILYEIDNTEKVTLTSDNGEICVKIPRWKGFSAEWTDSAFAYERYEMSNNNQDYMSYELVASWVQEDVDAKIAQDFQRYDIDDAMGDVCRMTVDGINIYYQPCYSSVNSQWFDRHYMIWADLGCGQFLKTRITHYDEEPLNIEGFLEALYANIEVCTPEGDALPITYREQTHPMEDDAFDRFSFGTAREYQTDEYRENTVCAGLIEQLYEAVQTGDIEALLQREALKEKKLSLAEKMAYIKNEETGTLIKYDTNYSHVRESIFPPTQCCLVEGADASKEFLICHIPYYWHDLYDFVWFPCETDSAGHVRAQKGIYVPGARTEEHYFLSFEGNPYLCIVNRDSREAIESVVLHDFMTPDLIGTVIYIDPSSVLLCSYVRSEASLVPWYLYDKEIAVGDAFSSMMGNWEVKEFLGESEVLHSEDVDSAVNVETQARTRDLTDAYLGQKFHMCWGSDGNDVKSFRSASAYGYYYTSPENLYKVYGQPGSLAMDAPIAAAAIQIDNFYDEMDILMDRNGKAAICVDGRFFLLEKTWEYPEERRTWE